MKTIKAIIASIMFFLCITATPEVEAPMHMYVLWTLAIAASIFLVERWVFKKD